MAEGSPFNMVRLEETLSPEDDNSEGDNSLSEDEEMEMMNEEEELEDEDDMDFVPFIDGVWYRAHERGSILLILEVGKRVYFSGKVELEPVKGSVEVLGHVLKKSSLSLTQTPREKVLAFSPKGHSSLLYIEGKDVGEDNVSDVSVPDGFAAVILRAFENEWTSGLRNTATNGSALLGPEIHTGSTPHPRLDKSEIVLKLPSMKHFLDKFGFQLLPEKLLEKNKLFVTDPGWENLFESMMNDRANAGGFAVSEKMCVFGGKSVGKSTFCRWLTNKFNSLEGESEGRVLYVDLDPGQTEFTPPGVVSLHVVSQTLLGPNFTHMRQPERAVFLAGVNVADFPVSYIHAVMELARFATDNYSNIPWIINTMGFSSGLGIPLAVAVIKIFRPSILVQLTVSNNPRHSFPFELDHKNISTYRLPRFLLDNVTLNLTELWDTSLQYNFVRMGSVFAKEINGPRERSTDNFSGRDGNPKSLRETMMISYFSNLIGITTEQNLLSVIPYRIKVESVTIGCMNSTLDWDGILRTLLGNLVALCKLPKKVIEQAHKVQSCSNHCTNQSKSGSELPGPGKTFIANCDSLQIVNEFLGYGICRAYDKKAAELLLVTPLTQEKLDQLNALICAGSVGLPLPLVLGFRNMKPGAHSYISGQLSCLDASGKKNFVPGRKSTHIVLRNSLLQ